VSPVIRFGAVGGATKAEKARRIGVGTQVNILDTVDARPRKARHDIAREVKQGMTITRGWAEEALAPGSSVVKRAMRSGPTS